MPPVAAAVVAAVSSYAGSFSIGSFLINTAISMAFKTVLGAIGKKPKAPKTADFGSFAQDRTVTVRQPTSAWPVIFGSVRVGGIITFISTSGSSNEFINIVITFTGHQVAAINGIYFDAELVPIDGNGDATGKYAGFVHVEKNLGTPGQAAFAGLMAEDPAWTAVHRQRGRSGIYVRLKHSQDKFPNGVPNITADLDGMLLFDPRATAAAVISSTASGSGFAQIATSAAHGLTAGGRVFLRNHVGASPEINGEYFVSTITDATHFDIYLGDGVSLSAGGTGGAAGVMAFSSTASLADATYILNKDFGRAANYDLEINNAALITAANICDEQVALADGGTEARYECHGTFKIDEKPSDIIGNINSSMGGMAAFVGGEWFIFAAAWRAPTVTLDEGDLRQGSFKVVAGISGRESFNGVKGVYTSAANKWQPADYPAVTNATYLGADNNQRTWTDYDLPFTTSAAAGQRLAKIKLEAARQEITVPAMRCKLLAYPVQVGDVVNINNTRMGWTAKPFEVTESKLVWEKDSEGVPLLGVDLALRETASAVYDWNSGEETVVDPAPNSNLPDPFTVAAPTGLVLTSGTATLLLAGDGTVYSRIKAAWTAAADTFVTGYEIAWRKSADAVWQPATFSAPQTEYFISPVDDGVAYDVAIRSVNGLGVRSDTNDDPLTWSALVASHTVVGKTAAPDDVSGFTASQNGAVAVIKWGQIPDADLAGYEIRVLPQGSFVWADATPLTEVTRGTQITTAGLNPGDWTLGIKARDMSKNYSANATTANLTIANVNTVIRSAVEGPDWSGAMNGFVKHWTGKLIPDSQDTDSLAADIMDVFVPRPVATCTYDAAEIDIGFDDTTRVYGDITSVLGPGEAAGTAAPDFNLDYHTAAGAYYGFAPWLTGSAAGRYFKGRVALDTSVGVAVIEGLTTTIDLPPRTEGVSGVTVTAGGTAINFATLFHSLPQVAITAQGSTALIATVAGISGAGFTGHCFLPDGTPVGGTVNWTATGP